MMTDMDLSVGRLLTLIELLQVYRQLNAEEIASRLEVSPRTVRRYITGLQDMGIPVETERGPAGGYRLRRGFKLPPLMLSNEEALVMIIGLLAAQRLGLSASGTAVQGALAKLDRLLPEAQRAQVQAMQDFVSLGLSPVARDHADATTILQLSTAARDRTGIRLTYRSAAGEVTERLVDPYGVAFRAATGTWSAGITFERRFGPSGSIACWRLRRHDGNASTPRGLRRRRLPSAGYRRGGVRDALRGPARPQPRGREATGLAHRRHARGG